MILVLLAKFAVASVLDCHVCFARRNGWQLGLMLFRQKRLLARTQLELWRQFLSWVCPCCWSAWEGKTHRRYAAAAAAAVVPTADVAASVAAAVAVAFSPSTICCPQYGG